MSTETQPSEHAMATARYLFPMGASIAEKSPDGPTARRMIENARYIDQHAIAPAVAERDRRIAELWGMLREYVIACYDGGENLSSIRNEELHAKASAILAKHGGAHE